MKPIERISIFEKSLTFCVLFFMLSMLPLHYMPPIYANAAFMHCILGNISIQYYQYAYLAGFILSGFIILSRQNACVSTQAGEISLIMCGLFAIFSILFFGWMAVLARLFAGFFGCLLYSRVYYIAYNSSESKVSIIGKVLGITSILLESSGFMSGIISNANIYILIKLTFTLIVSLLVILALFSSKGIPKIDIKNEEKFNWKNNLNSLKTIIPSVLAFTSFFLYIINIGAIAQNLISPAFIGFSLFTLAFAFPLGTMVANYVVNRVGYKSSLMFFCIFPLVGVPLQIFGIMHSAPLVLVFGSIGMAIGNGGIITINSAMSLITSKTDPSRPPLLYMLIAMSISLFLGLTNISFLGRYNMLYIMLMLYGCIAILVFKSPETKSELTHAIK